MIFIANGHGVNSDILTLYRRHDWDHRIGELPGVAKVIQDKILDK